MGSVAIQFKLSCNYEWLKLKSEVKPCDLYGQKILVMELNEQKLTLKLGGYLWDWWVRRNKEKKMVEIFKLENC